MASEEAPTVERIWLDADAQAAPSVLICLECLYAYPVEEEQPWLTTCMLCGEEMCLLQELVDETTDESVDGQRTTQVRLDEF